MSHAVLAFRLLDFDFNFFILFLVFGLDGLMGGPRTDRDSIFIDRISGCPTFIARSRNSCLCVQFISCQLMSIRLYRSILTRHVC